MTFIPREDDENLGARPLMAEGHNGSPDGSRGFTYVSQNASVRRLTPIECERLQGFPDDWTQLGGTPNSRRYAALGDAVTVNVAHWIGARIMRVAA